MSRDFDFGSPVVFSRRARYMLSTALITLALPLWLSDAAFAEDLYLNNGANEAPGAYTQGNGEWNSDSEIWSRDGEYGHDDRVDLDAGDVAILSARPGAPARDVTLEIAGQVAASVLRVDSSGYALVAGDRRGGNDPMLRGYRPGGPGTSPNLQIQFNGAAGADTPVLDVDVALGGMIQLQGSGQLNYGGQSVAQSGSGSVNGMLGLEVGADAALVTTGTTAGTLDVDGSASFRGDAAHDGAVTIGSAGLVTGEGTISGTVTNDGTIRAGRGAPGGSNTLSTGTIFNSATGTVGADNGATLEASLITNNGGTVNATGGGTIVVPVGAGGVINNGGGAVNVTTNGTLEGNITNHDNSQVQISTGGSVTGNLVNRDQGTVLVGNGGTFNGTIRNDSADSSVEVALGGVVEGGISRNVGAVVVDGTVSGEIRNTGATGSVTVGSSGHIGALNSQAGTAIVNGTVDGRVSVGSGSTVTLSNSSTVGSVNNAGTVTIAGEVVGNVVNSGIAALGSAVAGDPAVVGGNYTNTTTGDTTLSGATTVGGDFTNQGILRGQDISDTNLSVAGTFTNSGSILGATAGTATIQIDAAQVVFGASSVVSGNVSINGAVANGGTMTHDAATGYTMGGSLVNTPGGVVNVVTQLDGAGNNITNYSNYNVGAAGTATGIGTFSNMAGGVLTIAADAVAGTSGTLSAGQITNAQGGTINNHGILTGAVSTAGNLVSDGTINGALTVQATGNATLTNTVNGGLINRGALQTGGNLTVGALDNHRNATIGAGHTLTVQTGQVNNDGGRLNVNGVLAGGVVNAGAGTIQLGGGAVAGAVHNVSGQLRGTGSVFGAVTNEVDGDIVVAHNDTMTVLGQTVNGGDMQIGGTYAGAISNIGAGAITLSGGTLSGVLSNEALLTGTGTVSQHLVNGAQGTIRVGNGQRLTMTQGTENLGTIALAGGTISGAVTNSGDIGGGGRLSDQLSNLAGGAVTVGTSNTLVLDQGAVNAGVFAVAGTVSGAIDNVAGGAINLAGGRLTGPVLNSGSVTGSGRLGNLDNRPDGIVTVGDTDRLEVSGTLANAGNVQIAGTLAGVAGGSLDNLAAGTVTLQNGVYDGDLDNAGTLTGQGRITGSLENAASGTVTIADGQVIAVDDGTTNAGVMTVAGQLNGPLQNSTGTLNLSGRLQGTLTNTGGVVALNNGTLAGAVVNDNVMSGTGTFLDGLTNNGNATLGGTIIGTTENNSNLTVEGNLTVADLDNNRGATTVVRNGATLSSASTIANAQDAQLTVHGTVDFAGTGTADPDNILVDNHGRLNGSGRVEGTVFNHASGVFTMSGFVAGLVNEGNASLAAGQTLTTSRGIVNRLSFNNAGRLDSNVVNEADFTSSGTLNGTLGNSATGTATLSGSVNGLVENAGRVVTAGALSVNRFTNLANATTLVDAGHNMTALNTVQNAGTFELEGTLTGDLRNYQNGTLALRGGTVAGDVLSHGSISGTGRITGTLDSRVDLTVSEALRVGTLDNHARLTVENGTVLSADNAVINRSNATLDLRGRLNGDLENQASGMALLGNGSTIAGDVSNAGTLRALQTASIGGRLTNNGMVDMRNGNSSGLLSVGGIGGNGEYHLDIDLAEMTSDRIRVSGGATTGNLYFVFDTNSNITVSQVGERVTIAELDPTQSNNFTFGYDPIELSSARIVYDMVRNPTNGNLEMVSGTNPAIGALLGNVALTHSLIGSVINRPNSPYVVGMAYEDPDKPCGIGSWGRALGGTATANGNTNNGNAIYNSEVKANYYGMQVGTDLACFDGGLGGWSTAFGALLGVNQGSTEQPNYMNSRNNAAQRILGSMTTSDFDQIYGGIYMTATKGRWAIDMQYRHEVTDFEIDNRAVAGNALGISDAKFSSRANTISGAVSYMMPIAETGWQFVPSAGFAWSKFSIDDIRFNDGYKLEFEDAERKVGFLGGSVTKTFVQSASDSALNLFATGTYYKDFADETHSTFSMEGDPDFAPQYLTSDHLGSYTELSVGANYIKVLSGQFGKARQLSAGTRIDARFGDKLDSVGVTGQIRLQF